MLRNKFLDMTPPLILDYSDGFFSHSMWEEPNDFSRTLRTFGCISCFQKIGPPPPRKGTACVPVLAASRLNSSPTSPLSPRKFLRCFGAPPEDRDALSIMAIEAAVSCHHPNHLHAEYFRPL